MLWPAPLGLQPQTCRTRRYQKIRLSRKNQLKMTRMAMPSANTAICTLFIIFMSHPLLSWEYYTCATTKTMNVPIMFTGDVIIKKFSSSLTSLAWQLANSTVLLELCYRLLKTSAQSAGGWNRAALKMQPWTFQTSLFLFIFFLFFVFFTFFVFLHIFFLTLLLFTFFFLVICHYRSPC